jgi:hypothetical protein
MKLQLRIMDTISGRQLRNTLENPASPSAIPFNSFSVAPTPAEKASVSTRIAIDQDEDTKWLIQVLFTADGHRNPRETLDIHTRASLPRNACKEMSTTLVAGVSTRRDHTRLYEPKNFLDWCAQLYALSDKDALETMRLVTDALNQEHDPFDK